MICHKDHVSFLSVCFKEEVNKLMCADKLVVRAPSQEALEMDLRLLTVKEDLKCFFLLPELPGYRTILRHLLSLPVKLD